MDESRETKGTAASSSESRGARYRTGMTAAIILIAVLASTVSVHSANAAGTSTVPNQGHAPPMQLNATVSGSVTVSSGPSSPTTITIESSPTTVVSQSSSVQTQMSSSVSTVQAPTTTTMQTATTTYAAYCAYYGCSNAYPYPNNPYTPGYNPVYPGYYSGYPATYTTCDYAAPYSNSVSCSGYLYQAPNGCVELVAAVANPYYGTEAVQYYTLHTLSPTPPSGTWVTVEGQMYRGYNTSTTGAACPGNYINVSSITTG